MGRAGSVESGEENLALVRCKGASSFADDLDTECVRLQQEGFQGC